MNICIPVNQDNGLDSSVCAHFGSAPIFMVVDTDTNTCRPLTNANQHHSHGMCQPLASLSNEKLDAIVVGGIGMGALNKLQTSGIRVFRSEYPTVKATIDAFKDNSLKPVTPGQACGHHGQGHGHGHGHGHGQGGRGPGG